MAVFEVKEVEGVHYVDMTLDNETVRAALERGQQLQVHGWMYDLRSGTLRDLEVDCG